MLTVNVTADDIAQGKAHDPTACPIARALRRQTGFQPYVNADGAALHNEFNECVDDPELPDVAIAFIDAYDNGEEVQPFTFELDYRPKNLAS